MVRDRVKRFTHIPISCDTLELMKTTVEVSDELLERAKETAHRDETTLRALVEEGLRTVLEQRKARQRYHWPDVAVDGQGLHPELADESWEQLASLIYADRGA